NVEVVKQQRAKRDHRRHATKSTDEKINRNFPSPHRWPNDRLAIITGFPRNRTARNIDTAARHSALCPGFLAYLVNSRFVHTGCRAHACNVQIAAFCSDEFGPERRLFTAVPTMLDPFTEVCKGRMPSPAR